MLLGLTGGLTAGAGCKREPQPARLNKTSPTILDPVRAAAGPQITRYPLRFADVSASTGIQWKYANGATGKHYFVETTGGGVAFFDYNNDGLLDIFALQSGPLPGATGEALQFSRRSVLYRNNGNGAFNDVTSEAKLDGDLGYGQGVSVADYDNDGWADLYITAYGGNRLMHNNGDGTFTDVTQQAGLADLAAEPPWPLSAAWADYDNDGHLDLFICHYCRWSPATNRDCPDADGKPSYCRPQVYEPGHCRLYHNNGNGTFTDVTQKAGLGGLAGKNMSAAWFDYDDDGWMDLFVTNDTMPNFLLHNNRNGTFTDKAVEAGVAVGSHGEPLSGMGIGVGDYDNNGLEDVMAVNFSGEPKSLYLNTRHGYFKDAAYASGLASINLLYLGFGLECFDYDLDGNKDIIVGNGHVLDRMNVQTNGASYAQSQQLLHNQGNGIFQEDMRSLGDLALPRVTRGLAVGDYDNDGDWDVVMMSQTGPLQLYRNDGGNQNHWVTMRLEGIKSNRDAIGAKVVIKAGTKTQTQWVRGGSSYCSHSDIRVTFGLGDETRIDKLTVRWPSGLRQEFGTLPANQFYWLREGHSPVRDPRVVSK